VVTGVTITGSASISKGTFEFYMAQVEGDNLDEWGDDQNITWELIGANKPGTYFEQGFLAVAADETSVKITLKATSVLDPTKFGTLEITLTEAEGLIIVIENITGISGEVTVAILDSLDPDYYMTDKTGVVASGVGTIDGGKVTVALSVNNWGSLSPWNDEGDFYIKITKNYVVWQDTYVYTEGAPPNTSDWDDNPTYEFNADGNVTIDFDQFALIPLGEGGYEFTISGLASFNGAVAYLEVSDKSDWGSYPVGMILLQAGQGIVKTISN